MVFREVFGILFAGIGGRVLVRVGLHAPAAGRGSGHDEGCSWRRVNDMSLRPRWRCRELGAVVWRSSKGSCSILRLYICLVTSSPSAICTCHAVSQFLKPASTDRGPGLTPMHGQCVRGTLLIVLAFSCGILDPQVLLGWNSGNPRRTCMQLPVSIPTTRLLRH